MERKPAIEVLRPPKLSQRIDDGPVDLGIDGELPDGSDGDRRRAPRAVAVAAACRRV